MAPVEAPQELLRGSSAGAASSSEAGLLAHEPEVEDEADGWEIVPPLVAQRARHRSRTSSFRECSASSDKVSCTMDEAPEDLVVGCLDPECDAQFGEGSERRRCQCCRLWFCERHLSQWPLFDGSHRPRCSSGGSDGGSASFISSSCPMAAGGPLLESLGVSCSPGSMAVCSICRAALALAPSPLAAPVPVAASWQALPTGDEVEAAPAATGRLLAPGTDVPALAAEAHSLRAMSFAGLKAASEIEDPSRAVARTLLLRLLEKLRVCMRPWTEYEREWLWRLREELVDSQSGWVAQFARQATWDGAEECGALARLLEHAHAKRRLGPREALEVLGALGRNARAAAAGLGDRRLGLAATHAAEALGALDEAELACCLEMLLDAGTELGAAGATGGRRAVVGALLKAACGSSPRSATLRGELFWALEARAKACAVAAGAHVQPGAAPPHALAWASVALEELCRGLPPEAELGLLRQRAWVRLLERGQVDAARVEPAWGEPRAFPLAVWPLGRLCLGLEGMPREASSRNAPVMLRCRCLDTREKPPPASPGAGASAAGSSRGGRGDSGSLGLLLKRDSGMHREQQVGQTLRLLEHLIWEDQDLRSLLEREGLELEDARATYAIAMTGPGTAIVEAVEGARTLRDVRAGRRPSLPPTRGRMLLAAGGDRGTILEFLRKHNGLRELPKALARLAFTAATSAVLSFVAGLGDRHHENFMITVDGRLLHVDYGYALGREPLDSVLIHYAVQGGRPATLLQYEELHEALGPELLRRIFWPVVRGAYLRVRKSAGLLAEMVHTALLRDPFRDTRADALRSWAAAQAFSARHCATAMPEQCAGQFVHALLWHCARRERGARLRDEIKRLCLRERTQQAVVSAYNHTLAAGRNASSAVGLAAGEATDAVRGAASGLLGGVRGLILETGASGMEEQGQSGTAGGC